MKLKNLILASGLAAWGLVGLACGYEKVERDHIDIEDETYTCLHSKGLMKDVIYLIGKKDTIIASYAPNTKTMQIGGWTEPLTYWQAAELTEECVRRFTLKPEKKE